MAYRSRWAAQITPAPDSDIPEFCWVCHKRTHGQVQVDGGFSHGAIVAVCPTAKCRAAAPDVLDHP